MTDDRRLRQMADKLLKARAESRPVSGETPASGPQTVEEAYEVQRLVAAALGPAGAFKTGGKPGETPIMAPISRPATAVTTRATAPPTRSAAR